MFVIARHGNTFGAGETPRRIGARTDLPLTDKGYEQAYALGRLFADKGWHFSRALVSPLLRTRQTAEAILAAQPSSMASEPADFLREIDHGPDENRTEGEVLQRIGPEALAAWDAHAILPPGWLVDSKTRTAAWRTILAENIEEDRPLLLVTSNGAARFALMCCPMAEAAASHLGSLKLPTGSFGIIRRNGRGQLKIPIWGARP